MTALDLSGGNGGLRLLHKFLNLIHHLLLAWTELTAGDLLEIFFGCERELLRGALLRRMFGVRASAKLYFGLV